MVWYTIHILVLWLTRASTFLPHRSEDTVHIVTPTSSLMSSDTTQDAHKYWSNKYLKTKSIESQHSKTSTIFTSYLMNYITRLEKKDQLINIKSPTSRFRQNNTHPPLNTQIKCVREKPPPLLLKAGAPRQHMLYTKSHNTIFTVRQVPSLHQEAVCEAGMSYAEASENNFILSIFLRRRWPGFCTVLDWPQLITINSRPYWLPMIFYCLSDSLEMISVWNWIVEDATIRGSHTPSRCICSLIAANINVSWYPA